MSSELNADTVVGFTGTRLGMTVDQAVTVEGLLADLNVVEAHHGDCVGADADFDRLARSHGAVVIVHPPENPKLRAFCESAVVYPNLPYLSRNRAIVDACDVLIATPRDFRPTGGGTWYTVNWAWNHGKRVYVVLPDGEVSTILPARQSDGGGCA